MTQPVPPDGYVPVLPVVYWHNNTLLWCGVVYSRIIEWWCGIAGVQSTNPKVASQGRKCYVSASAACILHNTHTDFASSKAGEGNKTYDVLAGCGLWLDCWYDFMQRSTAVYAEWSYRVLLCLDVVLSYVARARRRKERSERRGSFEGVMEIEGGPIEQAVLHPSEVM